jgi:hypothetical protein
MLRRLLVTASVIPSSPILVTLMKEALSSSETLVLTRATRRNIPEDTILYSHRRENLKSNNIVLFQFLRYVRLTCPRKVQVQASYISADVAACPDGLHEFTGSDYLQSGVQY